MKAYALLVVGVIAAVFVIQVRADEIFLKGKEKSVKADVKEEKAKEVTTDKGAFAGGEVVDILYDKVKPVDLNLSQGAYRTAKTADKEAKDTADPAKRKAAIKLALDKYGETLKTMDRSYKYGVRHFEYRVAMLTYQQCVTEQLPIKKALDKLQLFKAAYPNSWQINHVMPLIAQIQMDGEDYKGAAETYEEMATMDALPDEMRLDSELQVVQVSLRAGNVAQANSKLDALAKKPGASPQLALRVKLARAEVLAGQKKLDEATVLLRQVLKDTSDRQIKALAHNTLGECLYRGTRYNEAVWEFLWVDAVYNQDRTQRARALYYLWQTFEKLNDAERAQQCRETLRAEVQFAGTEYQRLANAK